MIEVKNVTKRFDGFPALDGISLTVKDGAIAFTASSCPGQDCVHSGSIRHTGRSLVCLPNSVEIRVISEESDVDFVVG